MKTSQDIVNELVVINSKIQCFKQPLGFRSQSVYCLSREGQQITFAPPHQVLPLLQKITTEFLFSIQKDTTIQGFVQAITLFWIGFISIHPFNDGNGRTAKEFIRRIALTTAYEVVSFDLLDKVLLTGNLKSDIPRVETALLLRIQKTSLHSLQGEAI